MIYIQKVILYLSLKVQKKEKKNLNYVISVANQKIVNFFKDMTNYIKEDNIMVEIHEFFKFITTRKSFRSL